MTETIKISIEVDQSVMETLPLVQRQKLCRQVRQEQVKQYHTWADALTLSSTAERRRNVADKKVKGVNFEQSVCVLEATERFENQEGK